MCVFVQGALEVGARLPLSGRAGKLQQQKEDVDLAHETTAGLGRHPSQSVGVSGSRRTFGLAE